MPPNAPRPYAIAFSFPGERREYVEQVARALLPAFGGEVEGKKRIFYDAWHEETIIGYGSDDNLQDVYADGADLVVPFYCQDYLDKPWCGVEFRAIKQLLFDRQYRRVLPFRFDLVAIPGSFKTDVFPVVTSRAPEEIARLILERYNALQATTLLLPAAPRPPAARVGNLRSPNPVFVGRDAELKQLADTVFSGSARQFVVLHGVGGMGKTELAVAFAARHAEQFPAGCWMLGAEGQAALLPLVGELALDVGRPASAGPEETGEQRGRRVLTELRRRASLARDLDPDQGAACLLLLDNVSETVLLAGPQRAVLAGEDWLQVVATTRLAPADLRSGRGQGLTFVPVDTLAEEAACQLLQHHQPDGQWPAATAIADAAAARELVRDLGGFTLTVESVALYLGLHPEIRPAAYIKRLRKEGLPSADALSNDPDIAAQTRHRDKQLGLVLDATIEKLAAPERVVLEYAALLPPESIPWPWLQALAMQELPDAMQVVEGYPDPWLAVRTRLEGLRLLTPGPHPNLARLHRLFGAHLTARIGAPGLDAPRTPGSARAEQMLRRVRGLIAQMAGQLQVSSDHHTRDLWMLIPLQECIGLFASAGPDEALALASDVVGGVEMTIGRLDRSFLFLQEAEAARRSLHERAPDEVEAMRNLSVTWTRLGDLLALRGQTGDAEQSLDLYRRSLEFRERLLAANPDLARAARDVSVVLYKLADFLSRRGQGGDVEQAFEYYERSLMLSQAQLAATPDSAQAARDVYVSCWKLGYLLSQRGQSGDAEQALSYFEQCLQICEGLLAARKDSTQAARDVSVCLDGLGDFLLRRGQGEDVEQALGYYQRSLKLSDDVLAASPDSAEAKRDVYVSRWKLGDCLLRRRTPGDAEEALQNFNRCLEICEELRAANPESAQAARDVLVCLNKLAEFLTQRGQSGDAEMAGGHYQRILEVSEGMLASNPGSAQAARDFLVALEHLADLRQAAGDSQAALREQERSLDLARDLWQRSGGSLEMGRTLAISLHRTSQYASEAGQREKSAKCLEECLALVNSFARAGRPMDAQMRALYEQLKLQFPAGAA